MVQPTPLTFLDDTSGTFTIENAGTPVPPEVKNLSVVGGTATYYASSNTHTLTITGTGGVPLTRALTSSGGVLVNGGTSTDLSSSVIISLPVGPANSVWSSNGSANSWGSITNSNISVSAAIDPAKLDVGDANQFLVTTGTTNVWEDILKWHSTTPSAADHYPSLIQAGQFIDLNWDSLSSSIVIGTNVPIPDWHITGGADVTPNRVDISRGLEIISDGMGGVIIETNFEVPSNELNFGAWQTQTAILSADTAKLLGTWDLTDAGKASTIWHHVVEAEVALCRQSDSTIQGRLTDQWQVSASYNGSGVPTLRLTSEGNNKMRMGWQDNSGGLPTFTSITATVSTNNITFTINKDAGGNDCYGRVRWRIGTSLQMP